MSAPRLLCISRRVRHAEPLAALLAPSGDGWGVCFEHPAGGVAFAGAGAAWRAVFHGAARFRLARDAARDLLDGAVFAGDTDAPFAGARFFAAFSFEDDAAEQAPFAPATVFLPRWQVVRADGGHVLVKNILVRPDASRGEIAALTEAASTEAIAAELRLADAEARLRALLAAPRAAPEFRELGGGWFSEGVADALRRIDGGEARKIVLARAWRASASAPFSIPATFARLREGFPSCHSFAFSNGSGSAFVGATPECLADVSGGRLRTEALAGTAPRPSDAVDPARLAARLLADAKERREHDAVVETILSGLRAIGLDARADGPVRCLSLPHVLHLRTPLSAAVPAGGVHLLDIAAALHPTPATGGLPRASALAAIRALEPVPRGLYAGVLGWFDASGAGRLLVGLRSALVSGGEAVLFAGAGIVAGSRPARELAETQAKFLAMTGALTAPAPSPYNA